MKRTVLLIVVSAIVLITCVLWIIESPLTNGPGNILSLAVVILLVGFAVFLGIKRLMSSKRGEPAEDELSKKILMKASSVSYFVSIYLWLLIMYLSDRSKIEIHTLIGAGITGMALIFAISWLIVYLRGIRNE